MRIARESVRHPHESLRCMHLVLPAFRGALHRHRHLELTWIERGQGLRWIGDSVEPFFDGDLVLVGGDTAHLWASQGSQPADGCVATVLQFPAMTLRRPGWPELDALAPLMLRAGAGLAIQGETASEVQRLLVRLRDASALRRLAVLIDVMGALSERTNDLRVLSSRAPAVRDGAPSPDDARDVAGQAAPAEAGVRAGVQRIDRVLRWIEAHLAQELRVADAAAMAHVSPAAFARFFRREVGKSFTEYVNDARCGWAALRLTQDRAPVAQIAQDCGFATLSNFGEQFRRRYGQAPRAFREAARGLQALRAPRAPGPP